MHLTINVSITIAAHAATTLGCRLVRGLLMLRMIVETSIATPMDHLGLTAFPDEDDSYCSPVVYCWMRLVWRIGVGSKRFVRRKPLLSKATSPHACRLDASGLAINTARD